MSNSIQLLFNRKNAPQESEVRFVSNDLELIACTVLAATEIINSTLTKDVETGTSFLLSTDVGYFNLVKKEGHILFMAVDVESQSGLESLTELLRADPTFAYVEQSEGAPAIGQGNDNKDSNDSDCSFLDDDGNIIPEILWGFNPAGG